MNIDAGFRVGGRRGEPRKKGLPCSPGLRLFSTLLVCINPTLI